MKKALFEELLESVREGGDVLRGDRRPARSFAIGEPNVRDIRDRFGLSQPKFAALMGTALARCGIRSKAEGSRRVAPKCFFGLSRDIPRRFSTPLLERPAD